MGTYDDKKTVGACEDAERILETGWQDFDSVCGLVRTRFVVSGANAARKRFVGHFCVSFLVSDDSSIGDVAMVVK